MISVPLKVVGKAYPSRKNQTFPVVPTIQANNMGAEFPSKNTKSSSSHFCIQYSEQRNRFTTRFSFVVVVSAFPRGAETVIMSFRRCYTQGAR